MSMFYNAWQTIYRKLAANVSQRFDKWDKIDALGRSIPYNNAKFQVEAVLKERAMEYVQVVNNLVRGYWSAYTFVDFRQRTEFNDHASLKFVRFQSASVRDETAQARNDRLNVMPGYNLPELPSSLLEDWDAMQ